MFMTPLTYENIEKLLEKELKPIKQTLDEHTGILKGHTKTLGEHSKTLNSHSKSLTSIKASLLKQAGILDDHTQKLEELSKTVYKHTATLKAHGEQLDELVTDKRNRDNDKTIKDYRVSQLEEWAIKAGNKINLKFEV